MRDYVYNNIREIKQQLPMLFKGGVREIGSYEIEGQEHLALRTLFPDREDYIGCDMREGPGVDRIEDVMQMTFADNSVDTLLAVDTLEHVEDPFKMMNNIGQVLTDDGVAMVITVMNFRIHAYPDDYWRPTPSGMSKLVPEGMHAVVFYGDGPANFPETVGVFMSKSEIDPELSKLLKRLGYHVHGEPTSLVTGGAGFIGAHVVDHLIEGGHNVVVLDDLSGGFKENVNKAATFVQGSITDAGLVNGLFDVFRFDYVYHLAAYAAEGLSHFIRNYNYTNNLIGSVNLINASVKYDVKCFVFTSSIAVYGEQEPPMLEANLPTPADPYGVAKYAVEMDLKSAHDMFGLDYIIFRPHNVYGRYQNIGDKYRNVIGIFMNQILNGESLTIFGNGEQTRAFTHIDDVAPHIANSVNVPEAYGETINIGGDVPYTVNELADMVLEKMDMRTYHESIPSIVHLEPRNEVEHAYSDHSKAKELFDVGEMVSLEDGIADMAEWVKEVGSRRTPDFANIEVHKNMPPSWRR